MIVVKIGGTSGVNFDLVTRDIAAHVQAGQKMALVHGGSGETNAISEQLGHPPQFVTSPSGFTSRLMRPSLVERIRASLPSRRCPDNGRMTTLDTPCSVGKGRVAHGECRTSNCLFAGRDNRLDSLSSGRGARGQSEDLDGPGQPGVGG